MSAAPRPSQAPVAYRVLLWLYPPGIRRQYGAEMEEVFRLSLARTRAEGRGQARLWLRALRDTAVNATALWVRAVNDGLRISDRRDPRLTWQQGKWEAGVDETIRHVRVAVRGLWRRPGFTVVTLFTLAVGIGGNTAIFSLVDSVLFDPLPFPDDDRMVMVLNAPQPGTAFLGLSEPFFLGISQLESVFSSITAIGPSQQNLGGVDRPERVSVLWASAGFFDVVGIPPAVGRSFTAEEDVPGRDRVVVISDGLWERRFGRSRSAVGETLRVGDWEREIVGIMPRGFSFYQEGIDLWMPLAIDVASLSETDALNNNRAVIARLGPGVTPAAAAAAATRSIAVVRDRFPDALGEEQAVAIQPLRDWMFGDVRASLFLLLGAVAFVLLIACANLANLFLVRGEARRQEFAVRAALGAGRNRLMRQLLTESLILSAVGAVLGVGLAQLGLEAIRPFVPSSLAIPDQTVLDGTVLLFTAGVAVATGLLFGLVPAVVARRTQLRDTLVSDSRGATAGRRRHMYRDTLVAAEVAMAAVLLVGAGLLMHSLWRLSALDPGFELSGRIVADISLPAEQYATEPAVEAFYRPLLDRLVMVPSVADVAIGQWIPLRGSVNWGFELEDEPDGDIRVSDYNLVGPAYFRVMGIPLVEHSSGPTSGRTAPLSW